jgi:hypothetical protein
MDEPIGTLAAAGVRTDMQRSGSVIVAGSGPSARCVDWTIFDACICGVSSGVIGVQYDAAMFVGMDAPHHFPPWLAASALPNHVSQGTPGWDASPCVTVWPMECMKHEPCFTAGDMTTPCGRGPYPRLHSLLFAVQVLARLGYQRLVFVGVDLTDNDHMTIADILADWQPLAHAAGIEWVNASPMSTLQCFMPDAPQHERTTL